MFADIRRSVGKTNLDEVLVTGWDRRDDSTHSATVRWPRSHTFYTPTPVRYSLMLFTESVRQAVAVTGQHGLGVPAGHRMGWEEISCTLAPRALAVGAGPAALDLTITHAPFAPRRSGLFRLTAHVEAFRDGVPVGTARLRYTAYPPALYNRLRGEYADARTAFARALPVGPPVEPALVGRGNPRDVVLSPESPDAATGRQRHWRLRADTTHGVLFDHPHDHIPGMVLLEAASQAVQAAAAPGRVVPIGFDASFFRYVEFDQPCIIVAEPSQVASASRLCQTVNGIQDGEAVFTARITGATEPSVLHSPVRAPSTSPDARLVGDRGR